MMQLRGLLLFSLLVLVFAACQKTNNNTPIPQISLKSVIADSIQAGSSEDTVIIAFDYFDGDGDLGTGINESVVVLKDNRTDLPLGMDSMILAFPNIPDNVVDPLNGLRGVGYVFLRASRIALRTDTLHQTLGDTVTYKMLIRDNAGNNSNTIDLPAIRLYP